MAFDGPGSLEAAVCVVRSLTGDVVNLCRLCCVNKIWSQAACDPLSWRQFRLAGAVPPGELNSKVLPQLLARACGQLQLLNIECEINHSELIQLLPPNQGSRMKSMRLSLNHTEPDKAIADSISKNHEARIHSVCIALRKWGATSLEKIELLGCATLSPSPAQGAVQEAWSAEEAINGLEDCLHPSARGSIVCERGLNLFWCMLCLEPNRKLFCRSCMAPNLLTDDSFGWVPPFGNIEQDKLLTRLEGCASRFACESCDTTELEDGSLLCADAIQCDECEHWYCEECLDAVQCDSCGQVYCGQCTKDPAIWNDEDELCAPCCREKMGLLRDVMVVRQYDLSY